MPLPHHRATPAPRAWSAGLALALLCVNVCAATPAAASPLLELTGDPGGPGGLSARHTGPSAFSTYFNPALLPRAEAGLSMRMLVLRDSIDVTPATRSDADSVVAESASGAFRDDGNLTAVFPSPVPTQWLQGGCQGRCADAAIADPARPRPRQGADSSHRSLSYLGVGLVQRVVDTRLVLGLSLLVPVSDLPETGAFYNDEREQYFSNSLHPELYSDRLTPLSVAFGAGGQLLDSLSVGLSFTLNLNSSADSSTFVPQSSEYDDLSLRNGVEIDPGFAPHLGLAWEPVERLLLTASLHTEQAFRVRARFSSLLPDGSEQFASRNFTHHFVPMTAALGASYAVPLAGGHTLTGVAGAAFERWSTYHDRHDARPSGAYAWSDRLHPTVGLRHAVGPWLSGLDAAFLKSPVPAQTGRSNYVDNDRAGLSASLRRSFQLGDTRLAAGLALQAHRLLARSQHKETPPGGYAGDDLVLDEVPDDAVEKRDIDQPVQPRTGLQSNNPGYPGFSSGGWLLGGSVSLEVML